MLINYRDVKFISSDLCGIYFHNLAWNMRKLPFILFSFFFQQLSSACYCSPPNFVFLFLKIQSQEKRRKSIHLIFFFMYNQRVVNTLSTMAADRGDSTFFLLFFFCFDLNNLLLFLLLHFENLWDENIGQASFFCDFCYQMALSLMITLLYWHILISGCHR